MRALFEKILNHKGLFTTIGVIVIFIGMLASLVSIIANTPIPRSLAESMTGSFEGYTDYDDFLTLHIDEDCFYFLSNLEIEDVIKGIENGEEISVLAHPITLDILEIEIAGKKYLNFEEEAKKLTSGSIAVIVLGAAMIVAGIGMIIFEKKYSKVK